MVTDRKTKADVYRSCSGDVNLAFHGIKWPIHVVEIKTNDITSFVLAVGTNAHLEIDQQCGQ